MNKKIIGIIAVVIIIVAAYFVYDNYKEVDIADKNQTEKVETIKIGAILPLTGNLSYLGEEEKNVLQLLQDSINNHSDKKVKFFFEDSKGTSKDGVSAYQNLKQKGVENYLTSMTIVARAIAPLIDKNNHIQFVNSIDPDITKGYRNTFQVYYNIVEEVKLAVNYFSSKGYSNVSALYINTPESENAVNNYLKSLLENNSMSLIQKASYSFADKSLKNHILKIKESNPDIVYTIDFGYMYPVMLKDANDYKIKSIIFGGLGIMTAPPMDNALKDDLHFICSSFVVNKNPAYLKFSSIYKNKYEKNITFDGVYTFDSANILYRYIVNGKNNEFLLGKTFSGVSGNILIKENKSSVVDLQLAKFDGDGAIVPVNISQ